MPTIENGVQTVAFSETDGAILWWKCREIDVLYPQKMVQRKYVWTLRGGMCAYWPWYGTIDTNLPRNGVLRGRRADEVTGNGVVFRGRDLLGPSYDEEAEVRVSVELTRDGFAYTLAARLLKPATRDVFINPGLNPYFRTPTGNAVAGTWDGKQVHFYQRLRGPMSAPVNQGADVTIPGVGKVQMMLGGAWKDAAPRRMYFWRDSRNYLCVEPTFGNPNVYGTPDCAILTDAWFEAACTFQLTLE